MDIYHQIAKKIIKEQESIVGKLAWKEVANIPGVEFVNAEKEQVQLSENKQEAINNLVAYFNRLFGRASYEVTLAAVADILDELSPEEIPASLRERGDAIERITEDLYKRNVELAAKNAMLFKLRSELERKNEELEVTNSKLQLLDMAKDDFINIASHQLKTPVAIIQNSLEVAERRKTYDPELFAASRKQIIKLNRIVSEILLASRLTTKKFQSTNHERVVIEDLVRNIIKEQVQLYGAKTFPQLHSSLSPDFRLSCDQLYLGEALSNIISNAIKYSANKGEKAEVDVYLSLNLATHSFEFVCRDNGIGVGPEDLKKFFDKFERAKNAQSIAAGSGLGMFIAKEIVEGHGGKIGVTSKLMSGTQITISIPSG